jgi:hypothetical protein
VFEKRTAQVLSRRRRRVCVLLARARAGVDVRSSGDDTLLNMLGIGARQLPAFLELYGFGSAPTSADSPPMACALTATAVCNALL